MYLFAVVGGVGHAHQVLVGPAVHVGVLLADDAVAGVAGLALAAVHGVAVVAQVVALGVFVAVVRPICARVAGLAHLRDNILMSACSLHESPGTAGAGRAQISIVWGQFPRGRVWATSVLPCVPLQCPAYRLTSLCVGLSCPGFTAVLAHSSPESSIFKCDALLGLPLLNSPWVF